MSAGGRIRPVDAAAVLLLDRSGHGVRVLVGRRSTRHVFMPDVFVFPGGRRDRGDSRLTVAGPLCGTEAERLAVRTPARTTAATLRGLAVGALRELYEEADLSVGCPKAAGGPLPFAPDLSRLRYVARAVTPPGNPRRYDTRFFALFADECGVDLMSLRDSEELRELTWLDIFAPPRLEMPDISVMILEELRNSLQVDPSLPFGRPAVFFHTKRGRFVREIL
ncbi:hydrolase [Rhizobium sp. TRM95111]|uniref:NUDIX hydrolase n=1 Tax=Rhizobium alarense TaxID=2846851 RepID=UPI001F2161E2|nr:hydrolase [Rhizobium alarense]MCF3641412.1 hydrolase [Rhizobium alarense]